MPKIDSEEKKEIIKRVNFAQKVFVNNSLGLDPYKETNITIKKKMTLKEKALIASKNFITSHLSKVGKFVGKIENIITVGIIVGGSIIVGLIEGVLSTVRKITNAIKKIFGNTVDFVSEKIEDYEFERETERQNIKIGSGRSTGKLSQRGKEFLLKEEGLKTKAYQDSKGIWTIGVGHTGLVDGVPIGPGMLITEQKARELFDQDVAKFEAYVNKKVKVPVSQNQFDAMVSYAFNTVKLGPIFLQKLNAGDYKGAAIELDTINVELKGRRKREQSLFLEDVSQDNDLTVTEINPQTQITGQRTIEPGGGVQYAPNSNLTSRTLLTEYEPQYDPKAKTNAGLGTFFGKTITSGVGARNLSKGSSWHKGLDLRYAPGTPIQAFCSGYVTQARDKKNFMRGYGRVIIIKDKKGYQHVYGHLSSLAVSKDQYVTRGQVIGTSGRSGSEKGVFVELCYAPHLHYGIWKPGGTSDAAFIDPRTYPYPPEDLDNIQTPQNTNEIKAVEKADKAKLPDKKLKNNKTIKGKGVNQNINVKGINETKTVNVTGKKDIYHTTQFADEKGRISSAI